MAYHREGGGDESINDLLEQNKGLQETVRTLARDAHCPPGCRYLSMVRELDHGPCRRLLACTP
jgi:hypothetical protein